MSLHALAGGADIGQHEQNDVLLADAAGDLLFAALGLLQHDERIGREDAGVGGDGFGRGHADAGFVDAGGGPDAVFGVYAGTGRAAHRPLLQRDRNMGQDAFVCCSPLLRLEHDHLFDVEMPVVRAGDHRRAVVGCGLADQNGCAGHAFFLLVSMAFVLHHSTLSKPRQLLFGSVVIGGKKCYSHNKNDLWEISHGREQNEFI